MKLLRYLHAATVVSAAPEAYSPRSTFRSLRSRARPWRCALIGGLALPLAACIGTGQFVSKENGQRAPQNLVDRCRDDAQRHAVGDIDALPADPPAAARIGSAIGNSLGDAINFRNDVAQCLDVWSLHVMV